MEISVWGGKFRMVVRLLLLELKIFCEVVHVFNSRFIPIGLKEEKEQ